MGPRGAERSRCSCTHRGVGREGATGKLPMATPHGKSELKALPGPASARTRTVSLCRACRSLRELRERPCANHREEWVRVCRALGEAGWTGHGGGRDQRAQRRTAPRVRLSSACAGAPAPRPVGHVGLRPHSAWRAVPQVFTWGFRCRGS